MQSYDVILLITKQYIVTLINIIGKCSILILFIRVSSENSLEQYIKESIWSSWALCCLHENLGNKREVNYFFLWVGQIFSLGTQGLNALRIYCGSYLISIIMVTIIWFELFWSFIYCVHFMLIQFQGFMLVMVIGTLER